MSFVDKALLTVAPGFAAKRAQARLQHHQHSTALDQVRKYEAAKTGRRTEGWNRPGTSASVETVNSFSGLSGGARQMVRDNGHAANAVRVIANNVIGTGIRPEFNTGRDASERVLHDLWEEHAEKPVSGSGEIGGVYERQLLGMRSIVEGGSVIFRRRQRNSQFRFTLPYVVQVMEPDYLATHLDGLRQNGSKIVAGKEYNKFDELVAVHIYLNHPGEAYLGVRGFGETTRISASNFSHAFQIERAGQVQGASWFAPILTDLRDLADTRDAYQLRQKIAACYTAFIHESEPGAGTDHKGQPITDHIEPGRVESLPPGKEVTFASPPGVDGMSDFDKAQLLTIAVGLGIPYEALTGDLRNVSFLSGRMGWLAFYRNIEAWRSSIVIPRLCDREADWFLDAVAARVGLNEPTRVRWTSPHRDLLDPKVEIQAMREEMRLGALSYPDMVRMRGKDPQKVLDSWEKWSKEIDGRELSFDWQPHNFSLAGNKILEKESADDGEGSN